MRTGVLRTAVVVGALAAAAISGGLVVEVARSQPQTDGVRIVVDCPHEDSLWDEEGAGTPEADECTVVSVEPLRVVVLPVVRR